MQLDKKKIIIVIAGVIAITLSIMWLSGGFESKIDIDEIPQIASRSAEGNRVVAEVKTGTAIELVSGTLVSARHTTVASRVLARVEETRVRAGSDVSKGDVLIVLDSRDLRARVDQVKQQLQAATTKRNLARTERDRNQRLLREGAVSQERHDQSVAAYKVAIADVARLELSLKEAQTGLSHAEILAPVTGRVVDRLVEPGDTALPGEALLRIYDPNVLRVEVPVRESLAIHLNVGDVLSAEIPAADKSVEGTIDEIVPFAESGARTLLVKVRLPYNQQFLAGMFAKVSLPAGERKFLSIPIESVVNIGQLQFVEIVNDKGIKERRLITTGKSISKDYIEVLSGLAENEEVLVPNVKKKL